MHPNPRAVAGDKSPAEPRRGGARGTSAGWRRLAGGLLLVGALGLAGTAISAAGSGSSAADATEPRPPHPLVWDATEKTLDAKPGDAVAEFEFTVTNQSDRPVEILEVRPSCGCTLAEMPASPWVLAPGARGSFRAQVDFTGKHGRFSKGIYIITLGATQLLTATVNIPDTPEAERLRNQQLALADRQAVFRGECASCHAAPAAGKTGAQLFQAACTICHASERRASMVPDLLAAREPRDEAYWRKWISDGKESSLMPAFAQRHGGPLTDEQIESLIAYALEYLPTEPRKAD